jgi:hypothetical protein
MFSKILSSAGRQGSTNAEKQCDTRQTDKANQTDNSSGDLLAMKGNDVIVERPRHNASDKEAKQGQATDAKGKHPKKSE